MNPPPLPFARLALVDDPTPRDAATNMALDEVLLAGLDDDPILRIYRWQRRSISIGYFEEHGPARRRWSGHDLVRRWTGGGIVEHGDDVTFSLLVPRTLPLAALPAAESYRIIHEAVAGALPDGPVQVAASVPAAGAGSRACFERPVPHDLMLAGRKVAGGAQRRTRTGLLHQASVHSSHRSKFIDALPGAFGRLVHPRTLTSGDLDAALSLVETKYGTLAWQRRF